MHTGRHGAAASGGRTAVGEVREHDVFHHRHPRGISGRAPGVFMNPGFAEVVRLHTGETGRHALQDEETGADSSPADAQ